jgi:hypothetical protein
MEQKSEKGGRGSDDLAPAREVVSADTLEHRLSATGTRASPYPATGLSRPDHGPDSWIHIGLPSVAVLERLRATLIDNSAQRLEVQQ